MAAHIVLVWHGPSACCKSDAAWDGLISFAGAIGYSGAPTLRPPSARATAAGQWLAFIVSDDSTALVVTHGVFRRILAKQLLAHGWLSAGRRRGYGTWSAWSFEGG